MSATAAPLGRRAAHHDAQRGEVRGEAGGIVADAAAAAVEAGAVGSVRAAALAGAGGGDALADEGDVEDDVGELGPR